MIKGMNIRSNHEEGDTGIPLHSPYAQQVRHEEILIHPEGSDIFILSFTNIRTVTLSEMWIACGTGKDFTSLPVH